jgi:hypothetical protein
VSVRSAGTTPALRVPRFPPPRHPRLWHSFRNPRVGHFVSDPGWAAAGGRAALPHFVVTSSVDPRCFRRTDPRSLLDEPTMGGERSGRQSALAPQGRCQRDAERRRAAGRRSGDPRPAAAGRRRNAASRGVRLPSVAVGRHEAHLADRSIIEAPQVAGAVEPLSDSTGPGGRSSATRGTPALPGRRCPGRATCRAAWPRAG